MKFSQYNIYKSFNNRIIIFNTLTRGMMDLQEELFNEIQIVLPSLSGNLSADIKKLNDLGFIVDDNVDEYKLYKLIYNKERYSADAIIITLLLTNDCNFKCDYCFENNLKKGDLPLEYVDELIKFICKIFKDNAFKVIEFTFFGGEPLLKMNLIKSISSKLLDLSKNLNTQLYMHIVTNGYLLTIPNIEKLVKYGITSAQITIDGEESSHNKKRPLMNGNPTYHIIIHNMYKAIESGMEITVNLNYDNSNYKEIIKFLEFLPKDIRSKIYVKFTKILSTKFNDIKEIERAEELEITKKLYQKLVENGYNLEGMEFLEEGPCMLEKRNSIIMNTNGDISKCLFGIDDSRFVLGNILDDCFYEKFPLNNPFIKPEKNNLMCKKCEVISFCKEGCYRRIMNNEHKCNKDIILNGEVESIMYQYILNEQGCDKNVF